MAEELTPPAAQQDVELDNGIVLSGMGGDVEELREQFEQRADEHAGEPVEPVAEAAPVETPAPEAPKQARGPKRYAQLTKEREDAQRVADAEKLRADAAEARARDLEARLNVPSPVVREEQRQPAAPMVTTEAPLRAMPLETEVGTKYATYADFILDTSRWAAEEQARKTLTTFDTLSQARIEADRASRSQADLASQAFARGRSVYPDFDAVINAPDVTKILIPPDHQRAILAAPEPEHIMYELAKNPTKLAQIIAINDGVKLGMELALLVPRAAVASPASTAPVVRTTNVPAPPQPVAASTRTTSPSAIDLANKGGDDYDSSGYREKRRQELARR